MNELPAAEKIISPAGSVRITTGSRLHFGLLDTAAPFGGIGAMIDNPQTEVLVKPAAEFSCDSKYINRLLPIAERLKTTLRIPQLPQVSIEVIRQATPHAGLGSGTQLSMSVAEGIAVMLHCEFSNDELARIADRGKRSAIGAHGYRMGGVIFETSQNHSDLNPVNSRLDISENWRVVLFQPTHKPPKVSGENETAQFRNLPAATPEQRFNLVSLIENQILPAAEAADFVRFANAVQEYNRSSGALFQTVQGGCYNGQEVTELVQLLNGEGAIGVGQSSWGPTVFAWFESETSANEFCHRIKGQCEVLAVTKPRREGRQIQE